MNVTLAPGQQPGVPTNDLEATGQLLNFQRPPSNVGEGSSAPIVDGPLPPTAEHEPRAEDEIEFPVHEADDSQDHPYEGAWPESAAETAEPPQLPPPVDPSATPEDLPIEAGSRHSAQRLSARPSLSGQPIEPTPQPQPQQVSSSRPQSRAPSRRPSAGESLQAPLPSEEPAVVPSQPSRRDMGVAGPGPGSALVASSSRGYGAARPLMPPIPYGYAPRTDLEHDLYRILARTGQSYVCILQQPTKIKSILLPCFPVITPQALAAKLRPAPPDLGRSAVLPLDAAARVRKPRGPRPTPPQLRPPPLHARLRQPRLERSPPGPGPGH